MAAHPIRLFPDPLLRKTAVRPQLSSKGLSRLIKNLEDTLDAQPCGIGIAAPQVGESLRVIVVDVSPRDPTKRRHIMVNPELISAEGQLPSREGCMSLPDYTASLVRSATITVGWTTPDGRASRMSTSGIEAVCLQHEIDHLNGVLFIDRVACLKTDAFFRRPRP